MEEETIREAILVTENNEAICGVGFPKKCKGKELDHMVSGSYRGSVFWVCTGCAEFNENTDIQKVSVEELEKLSDNVSNS